jgi:hypothetical protein
MTIAIPKAAPVIQQLGGDVKDLAFFLTAMKEGGINASESANALKSGLASLINPTNTASKMLQGFGINLREIVQGNKGDVKKTVVDFAKALDTLDPLNRAKAIEQLFGKFQFARMSTLFKNVIEQGSQASEVLKLTSATSLQLSMLAQKELSKIEQSPLYKFQKSIADFQAQLAPVGEQFMKALTPVINFGTDVLKSFNSLNDGVKGFIVKFVAVAGVIGPVLLMSFGLVANAVANVIKGFALMKDIFNKTGKSSLSLGEQVNYMTQEQIQAAAIASSLDQVHSKLKQTFTSEAAAVDMLTKAYERSVIAQKGFAVPVTPRGPVAPVPARKYAAGGFITGPGTGTSDSILARVSNGEAIIPARSVAKNPDMVRQLISGNIPGFSGGGIVQKMFRLLGNAGLFLTQGVNAAAGRDSGPGARRLDVISDLERGGAASASPLLVSIAKKMGISLKGVENNTELQTDLKQAGSSIISTVVSALKQSTKEFVKDADIEELVVPALKGAAKNITLAGKSVEQALDQTLSERNVVTMRGIKGGSKQAAARVAGEVVESSGRAAAPGTATYIGERATSQKVATILNPEIFAVKERASKSSKTGFKKYFAMKNIFGQDEPGQISHVQTGQDASYNELEQKFSSRQLESIRRKLGPTNVENAIAKERGASSGEAFIDAQNAVLDKPQNDPAMVSRDAKRRNSPHSQVPIDGRDDGVAYSQARTDAIAKEEAKAATKRNRRVTSQGPFITPGETQAQQVQRTRGIRVASQGESFLPEQMVVINPNDVKPAAKIPSKVGMENAVTNPSEMMTARKISYVEKAGASLKFGKGFQGKMFGTSMGLGMASM